MSEMIERVARAIQDKCRERGFNVCPAPLVFHVAAAAIEAMREPTTSMVNAALECDGPPSITWQAMIDEALK